MQASQAIRPGFVYSTADAATILGTTPRRVRAMCGRGEFWNFDLPARWRKMIALDIDGTERLLGRITDRSRRARAAGAQEWVLERIREPQAA